jgi:hypothetical protein
MTLNIVTIVTLAVALLVVGVANRLTCVLGKAHYEDSGKTKLMDIGHLIVPRISAPTWALDAASMSSMLPLTWAPDPFAVVLEFLPMFLTLMVLRALTTVSTILPKDRECISSQHGLQQMVTGHCYDKVFSGHLTFVLLWGLVFVSRGLVSKTVFAVYAGAFVTLLLAIRAHYTVDLIIAAALTSGMFALSHSQ